MFRAALVMLLSLAALTLCGGRHDVSVLSGTIESPNQALMGLLYAAAWLASVLLVPPLLLASAALQLRARFKRRRLPTGADVAAA